MSVVEEFEKLIAENCDKEKLIAFFKKCTKKESLSLLSIYEDLDERITNILINENTKDFLANSDKWGLSEKYKKELESDIREINDPIIKSDKVLEQRELLFLAEYFSSHEKEPKLLRSSILKIIERNDILDWFSPKWLCQNENYFLWNSYNIQLHCIKMKQNTLHNNDIADRLSQTEFITLDEIPTITLNEHIWYLFEYENVIHNPYEGKGDAWIKTFQELIWSKKIDKIRVLNEAMLTATRFGNRAIAGYFFRLVEALKPNNDDLINLQDTLLPVLQTQHSKPINQTLKYLKRIHKDPSFNLSGFMEQMPLLLSWNVKAVVNGTLSLTDALMKAYPDHKEALGLLVVQTLGQEDESLQIKAVKLLTKHKLLEMPGILEEIDIFSEGLYHSTKQMLPSLDVETIEDTMEITPPTYIREDNRIIYPESFDEMVFFFSQVFEGNYVYDFDLFVTSLPKLHSGLNKKNIDKLLPAFDRAYKYYKRTDIELKSEIIFSMAQAFLYYGYTYLSTFNKSYGKIAKYYQNMVDNEQRIDGEMSWRKGRIIDFGDISTTTSISNIYIYLLSKMLQRIESNIVSVPIYAPTHAPCWIDVNTLFTRIKNTENIDTIEFQIAFGRTVFNNVLQSNSLKNNEPSMVFSYYINEMPIDMYDINTPSLWITALLRKNNANDLHIFANQFQIEMHDIPFSNIFDGDIIHKNAKNTTFSSHSVQLIRTLSFNSIYRYTRFLSNYSSEILDLPYILYISPFLPNFILEALYKTPRVSFEKIMPSLLETWGSYGDNNYLFLARTFTDASKATRQFTAELWIKAIYEGTMNHQLLGETLGKLEHNEYAPLKRFTDLMVSNMLNISSLHNKGLRTLLSAMIAQMNDEPIKGTKKLLEIYLEVLSLTKLDVHSETLDKLGIWGEVKSLRSVVNKIKKG